MLLVNEDYVLFSGTRLPTRLPHLPIIVQNWGQRGWWNGGLSAALGFGIGFEAHDLLVRESFLLFTFSVMQACGSRFVS